MALSIVQRLPTLLVQGAVPCGSYRPSSDSPLCVWEVQDELLVFTLSFLEVAALVQRKQVNKRWQQLCTHVIDAKCTEPKSFEDPNELWRAVNTYCRNFPTDIEKIACTYGYPIGKWDVKNICSFAILFQYKRKFNEDISTWDVSNAKSMYAMFCGADSFNKPLNTWNTSNVGDMRSMFASCEAFDQDISAWDVSKVRNMRDMFNGATSFNQNITSWNISQVRNMSFMFCGATSFNQPLGCWDTSSVKQTYYMFKNATSFNQNLDAWDLSRLCEFQNSMMFSGATSFKHCVCNQSLDEGVTVDCFLCQSQSAKQGQRKVFALVRLFFQLLIVKFAKYFGVEVKQTKQKKEAGLSHSVGRQLFLDDSSDDDSDREMPGLLVGPKYLYGNGSDNKSDHGFVPGFIVGQSRNISVRQRRPGIARQPRIEARIALERQRRAALWRRETLQQQPRVARPRNMDVTS